MAYETLNRLDSKAKTRREKMETIDINFDQYCSEALRDLNSRLVSHLKLRHQRDSQMKMHKFELGDIVCFENKYGEVIEGKIIRFNQKTITIERDCGHQWRVSPALLEKVIKTKKQHRTNIIELPVDLPLKMGKNKPCPCGSGKKFKRCCINNLAPLFS